MSPYYFEQPKQEPKKFNWEGAINAGMGGLGILANSFGMANQGLGINMEVPEQNQYGQPVYGGGELAAQINNAQPQGATGGEILGGAAQGLQAGAALGPVGVVGGAVVGAVSSIFGGRARKRRQERERERARNKLGVVQQNYNTTDVAFRDKMNQQSEYLDKMNDNSRYYNLYR